MPEESNTSSPPPAARILVESGTCVTFACGDRVFEVCAEAGEEEPPDPHGVDPGGIATAIELPGVVDLHELEVDWKDVERVPTFRARG